MYNTISVAMLLATAPVARLTNRIGKKAALLVALGMSGFAYASLWFTFTNVTGAYLQIPLPWGAAGNTSAHRCPAWLHARLLPVGGRAETHSAGVHFREMIPVREAQLRGNLLNARVGESQVMCRGCDAAFEDVLRRGLTEMPPEQADEMVFAEMTQGGELRVGHQRAEILFDELLSRRDRVGRSR